MVKFTFRLSIWDVLLFLIGIVLLYMILTRVFEHSATDIQIYLGFVSGFLVLTGFILKQNNNFSNINREVGEIKISMINSFGKVREDISGLKDDIKKLSKGRWRG